MIPGVEQEVTGVGSELLSAGLIKTWYRDRRQGWTLVSGLWSPYYIQLRPIVSRPSLLRHLGRAFALLIRSQCPQVNRLLGIAMAGIPLAVAASLESGIAAAFTRPGDEKEYGSHATVEGDLADGDRVALVDDVVTRFDSKRKALAQLREAATRRGIHVLPTDVVVVVDRAQGAEKEAESSGVCVHSLFRMDAHGLESLRRMLAPIEFEVLSEYLRDSRPFQDPVRKAMLEAMSSAAEDRGN